MSNSLPPVVCSPPGSSVHGILQARILEWVAICFSRDLPHPGIEPGSTALQTGCLLSEPPGKLPSCILNHNWKWHQEATPSTTITESQACILERLERWALLESSSSGTERLGPRLRWGLVVAGRWVLEHEDLDSNAHASFIRLALGSSLPLLNLSFLICEMGKWHPLIHSRST